MIEMVARALLMVAFIVSVELAKRYTYGDTPLPGPFSYLWSVIVSLSATLLAYRIHP